MLIIHPATTVLYQPLVELWQRSVEQTHHFLCAKAIAKLKPQLLEHYLPSVQLLVAYNKMKQLVGFAGTTQQHLAMLFVDPDYFGQGYGKALLQYCIKQHGICTVDVNEVNQQAYQFYLRQGFRQVGRSLQDEQGNPYPILHLSLVA